MRWLLRAMVALTATATLVSWLIVSTAFATWVAVGGFGCIGLTWLFALRAFSVDAASDAKGALGAMVKAEALKMSLATVGFVALAIVAPEHFGAVMIGFASALTGYWFALAFAARMLEAADAPGDEN